MTSVRRLMASILFLAAAFPAAGAAAAELKVLSVEAMKPALQELAKSFEATSKDKLKIEYASAADVEKKITAEDEYDIVIVDKPITQKLYSAAKVAGGSTKALAKKGADMVYEASITNWTQEPLPANEVIKFLATPKAAEVYKANGMQPG